MAVLISGVEKGSPAARAGIRAGETLLSIGGNEIVDVLDYRFYMMERVLKVRVADEQNGEREVTVHKGEYDDLGLQFNTYLMDKQRSCRNKCVFCFIDQMPPGMRETLYFKDDDARMSFLYGNYITLTNLSEHDIERTIRMKISPINISVHTTNPELRCKMMNTRFAGEALNIMKRFADAGIALNAQLVLCPGLNDGEELRRSLQDLSELVPSLKTVSCVPVGLTKYRDGLYPLRPFTKEEAAATIDLIDSFGDAQEKETGERLFYASDEFYIEAGRPIPPASFYGDFNQLENGVGLLALQKLQFAEAVEDHDADDEVRELSIATGEAAAPFLQALVDEAAKKWHNLKCRIIPVRNDFFGEHITVAGLVTGKDLIAQLGGRDLGKVLLIPDVMLKFHDDVFLDDVSLEEAEAALGVPICPTQADDGWALLESILENGKD